MAHGKMIDRREFTLATAMAVLAGVAVTVSGCSSDSSSPAAPSSSSAGTDKTGTISANHGHTASITAAQLAAGGGVTLAIQGTSAHPHSVTLAASDLTAIAANQRVSKESTVDAGHSHTVTFN